MGISERYLANPWDKSNSERHAETMGDSERHSATLWDGRDSER